VIFFGCAWIFMNLFRGDIVDRSLHYYFLAPVRREVLVCGSIYPEQWAPSFCSAPLLPVRFLLLLRSGILGQCPIHFWRTGLEADHFLHGDCRAGMPGLRSILFVNRIVFPQPDNSQHYDLWLEWLNFLLPPFLKKISVIHYLTSLAPVPISQVLLQSWQSRLPQCCDSWFVDRDNSGAGNRLLAYQRP